MKTTDCAQGGGMNVAVLMGGVSSEREISLASGAAVVEGLQQAGYHVQGIDVQSRELALPSEIEAVFIAMHGEFGEDGEIQSMLAKKKIPFTGSGAEASRIAFDKCRTRKTALCAGVPVPAGSFVVDDPGCPEQLPVVIKPPREGSSIGVHKVDSPEQWTEAARDTLSCGQGMLIEAYIPGRELTVGIVGHQVLPIVEICAPQGNYSYEAKYTKGKTEYRVPAPLQNRLAAQCQNYALNIYRAIGCSGMARVDFRLSPDNKPYLLELNTIPGFTQTSLLPKAAAAFGWDFSSLCSRIMTMASVS